CAGPHQWTSVAAAVVVREQLFFFECPLGRDPEEAEFAAVGFAPEGDAPTLTVGGQPRRSGGGVVRVGQALGCFVEPVVARAVVDHPVAVVVDAVARFDPAGEGLVAGIVAVVAAGAGCARRVACAGAVETVSVLIGGERSKSTLPGARVA